MPRADLAYYEKKLEELKKYRDTAMLGDELSMICLYHDGGTEENGKIFMKYIKRNALKKILEKKEEDYEGDDEEGDDKDESEDKRYERRYECKDKKCKKSISVFNLIRDLEGFIRRLPQLTDEEVEKIKFLHRCGFERRSIKVNCIFHDEHNYKWMAVDGKEFECHSCAKVGSTSNLIRLIDIFGRAR